ncbi:MULTISPECIES: zf-HC2 domain-containing protein [Streptomyces]|uniref:zf-HC2 domain-containing protein n=1 Tax=Streptomyces TaxID=1883 RepID=UPI001E39FA45|nr:MULTISPECIES: zf-HC2 domain-containing protein [Streptomyces]UFQ15943.1 zf-HC2 domain-containing protein [Streptomyces huasconensis]WCL85547.1 zf-HC2 domain-containing protein [Streptomyces sp. JCM 35825]
MTGSYGHPYDPYDHHGGWQDGTVHEAVGAYALGVLDEAENAWFEAHLAGCEPCARHLEEFSAVEPMLAALADLPGGRGAPEAGEPLAARPGPRFADRLLGEVSRTRERRRRRGLLLVAAAVALIVGGPLTVLAVSGDGDSGPRDLAADPHPTSPAEDAFFHHMEEKREATDPATKVSATVGTEKKAWGTHAVLELKNVKGPLKCSLVAVGKDGTKETVTSWSVPKWGYGIKDSPNKWARGPLYVHGGAAMDRNDIDHFEVTTFDGDRLVEVDV